MKKSPRVLWQYVQLPQWDASRMYGLFVKVNGGTASRAEEDLYCRFVMIFIAAFFARGKWWQRLRSKRLDAEDVAADVLVHVQQQSQTLRLEKPCVLVLLAVLNTAVFRRIMVALRQKMSMANAVSLSDWGGDEEANLKYVADRHVDRLRDLVRFLREHEDRAGPRTTRVLYRFVCRQIVRNNEAPTHRALPIKLRKKINPDEYLFTTSGVNDLCRQFAETL